MLLINKIKLDYAYVVFVTDYKVFEGERFEELKKLFDGIDIYFNDTEVKHVTYLASRNDISPEQKLVEKCMRFLLGEKIDINLLETLKKKL